MKEPTEADASMAIALSALIWVPLTIWMIAAAYHFTHEYWFGFPMCITALAAGVGGFAVTTYLILKHITK